MTRNAFFVALAVAQAGCSGCSGKETKGRPADAAASATVSLPSASAPSDSVDTPPPLPPQGKVTGYEGTIAMKLEAPGLKEPLALNLVVRGARLAYDAPNRVGGNEVVTIYDADLHRMVLVNREDKVYFVLDTPAPDGGSPNDAGSTMPLTPTGKKDKVDGVACDVWESTGPKQQKTTACIVDGIPFMDYGNLSNRAATPPTWLRAMSGEKRFPARVVQTAEDGALVLRFVVTKFSKHPVAEGFVSVPSDFKKQSARTPGTSPFKPGLPD